ncbi:hypothetical protein MES5069_100005 [Mesorhizobium escarrei]|uniref:HTH-like domain-containing protein n=1 Tax=Mesorhizobium escarrei TaxID=666018 RepID=A0ABM9DH12_9HYPH|nr:hypothetical protein MES5069_100005 [Mesorhizobium escarrei]
MAWLCSALDVSRSGFHAGLIRSPSTLSRYDEALLVDVDRSFKSSDRTYGTRRVWYDVLAEGLICGLHRIERLMRENGLRARPCRRGSGCDTPWEQRAGRRAPDHDQPVEGANHLEGLSFLDGPPRPSR